MARKAKKRRPKDAPPKETKAVESLTVAWMLSVMTALLCQVGGTLAKAFAGAFSLILLLAVVRLRKVKPPSGVLFFAIVVAAAPILVILFSWLQRLG